MKTERMKASLKAIAGTFMLFTSLLVAFAAAYFLTLLIYDYTGWRFGALVTQLINSISGIILLGIVGTTLARIFRSRHAAQELAVIAPIVQALENIARGNFDVRIDHRFQGREVVFFGELANRVNQTALDLKEMEAMRQEFISNVSHEIQSPLTSIRGFAQALHNPQLSDEEHSHYLTIIETESMRLSKLSDNLLALAALDAKNIPFAPKRYRLDKQIRNLILASEPQWSGKQLDLVITMDEVQVNADEDLLSQVWINLLHNAIKFTPTGGMITVGLVQRAEQVVFRIADTGCGITNEDQPRIFERFFKGDKARNRSLGGSGLGLSIAKKIVEMHKGEIRLESSPDAGATFVVALPIG